MQILADLEGENASIVSLLVTEICTKKFLGAARRYGQSHWSVIFVVILLYVCMICKVGCSNTSRLEAHAGIFKLLMKGIFNLYVL